MVKTNKYGVVEVVPWEKQTGGGGTGDYEDLTNKPKINNTELNGNKSLTDLGITQYVNGVASTKITTPTGGSSGQVLTKTDSGTAWEDSTGGVTSVNGKTGTVVLNNTDVGAAAASHTHTKSQITDFQHSHVISDVTDLQNTLDGKITTPSGGTSGQVLTKTNSGVIWATPTGGVTSVNGMTGAVVLDIPQITLGPCTALGYISGNQPSFGWTDPDNVIMNNSVLAEWNETVLVRKEGSYPANKNDGTTLTSTTKAAGNKNYYRDHNYTDTTAVVGTTYYYKLFSGSTVNVYNNLTGNQYTASTGLSWPQIQAYVRAGRGAELFPVGTVFEVYHSEYSHTNGTGLLFRVVGHDLMNPADETLTHSMLLDMVDIMFLSQYDAPEYLYALTADTIATTGKIYYTLSGSTYTALVEGTDWNPGDPVPTATWYEKNDQSRANNGNNNPLQSNLLQWLNSNALGSHWFTPKNIWDKCTTSLADKAGFCRNIDSDFLSVVATATLKTALHTIDGGGITTHTAKFFPLSLNQMFETQTGENVKIPYYSNNDLRKKTLFDGVTYKEYWMRTPHSGSTGGVYCVTPSGSSDFNVARYTYGVSPACIIA